MYPNSGPVLPSETVFQQSPKYQKGRVTSPGGGMKPFIFGLDLREVAGFSIQNQQAVVDRLVRHVVFFGGSQELDCTGQVSQVL